MPTRHSHTRRHLCPPVIPAHAGIQRRGGGNPEGSGPTAILTEARESPSTHPSFPRTRESRGGAACASPFRQSTAITHFVIPAHAGIQGRGRVRLPILSIHRHHPHRHSRARGNPGEGPRAPPHFVNPPPVPTRHSRARGNPGEGPRAPPHFVNPPPSPTSSFPRTRESRGGAACASPFRQSTAITHFVIPAHAGIQGRGRVRLPILSIHRHHPHRHSRARGNPYTRPAYERHTS